MNRVLSVLAAGVVFLGLLTGCRQEETGLDDSTETYEGTAVVLADKGITVDGKAVSKDTKAAVYTANDIVYYESGKDFTYGEGDQKDAHTKAEADAHTVVHITKPGQYVLSGKLSKGQIAVDLGEDAAENPDAVVTLVLDGVDITCDVAPAVIFYNVYECGEKDEEKATKDVDTTKAGARVVIANNTENTVNGSYVAKIYKPGTVELNKAGTEVEDAKKLHKYDGAFYSKMSMTVQGGNTGNGNGVLNIKAANEGLDSELHLTINGGVVNIESGNDGINTNEDNISVTTINGGRLTILVNGSTGEGDGIDSNGWLVINGGAVYAQACANSGDAGIDSDKGIHINGGTVCATGHMLDRIGESQQNYAVFTFADKQQGGTYALKGRWNKPTVSCDVTNAFTYLIVSDTAMKEGTYQLCKDGVPLKGSKSETGDRGPGGMTPPEKPDGTMNPNGETPPEKPNGDQQPPDGQQGQPPEPPEGMTEPQGQDNHSADEETSKRFVITKGGNYFQIG